jgi:hypothetical protein
MRTEAAPASGSASESTRSQEKSAVENHPRDRRCRICRKPCLQGAIPRAGYLPVTISVWPASECIGLLCSGARGRCAAPSAGPRRLYPAWMHSAGEPVPRAAWLRLHQPDPKSTPSTDGGVGDGAIVNQGSTSNESRSPQGDFGCDFRKKRQISERVGARGSRSSHLDVWNAMIGGEGPDVGGAVLERARTW